jgi:hypothetical protein
MRAIISATLLAAALAAAGCVATVATPDLVYVSPGVQVIADYDEPIFYSDGFYWRFYSGAWYRSAYYTGGWAYAAPPAAIVRINRPYAYAHYRPAGWRGRAAPAPAGGGWRGAPAPAASGGWRGTPSQPAASGGWRGSPGAAPAPGGGWRGTPTQPQPHAHQPPPPHSAPAPAPKPGGWRGRRR